MILGGELWLEKLESVIKEYKLSEKPDLDRALKELKSLGITEGEALRYLGTKRYDRG